MPVRPTKGKAQFATQLRADLLDQFREYAKGRGETLSAALERAMEREMDSPPAPNPKPEPFPPITTTEPAAKRTKRGNAT